MNIQDGTATRQRSIGGKTDTGTEVSFLVNVPTPYLTGHVCSEGESAILNQVLAENVSNNLRAKLLAGVSEGTGDSATTRAFTETEAQALVDEYVASYEPGVRRGGGGEPRVTDPVEKEARAISREKAKEFVTSQGGKPKDYDMGSIASAIFEANRDTLMSAAKKIVDQRNKNAGGINLDGISLTPASSETPADDSGADGK